MVALFLYKKKKYKPINNFGTFSSSKLLWVPLLWQREMTCLFPKKPSLVAV